MASENDEANARDAEFLRSLMTNPALGGSAGVHESTLERTKAVWDLAWEKALEWYCALYGQR